MAISRTLKFLKCDNWPKDQYVEVRWCDSAKDHITFVVDKLCYSVDLKDLSDFCLRCEALKAEEDNA